MFTMLLKMRKDIGTIVVPAQAIDRIMNLSEETAKKQLYKLFSKEEERVHDVTWLEHIINWTPKEGYSFTELVPWIKLIQELEHVDIAQEYSLELPEKEAELIFEKVTHPQFKYLSAQGPFISFVLDFFILIGHSPDPALKAP